MFFIQFSSIINNDMLNRIIEKIVVSKDGKKNIYLRLFDDIGLDETVHITDNYTHGCNKNERFLISIN